MKKTIFKLVSFTVALAIATMSIPASVNAMATKGDNLLADAYDPGFENGSISTSKWNLSGTVERVSDVKHSGSYSAKSTTRNAYSGPQAKFSDLTVGNQYYVSAWVYTTQAGQTAKMCLAGATNVRTSTVNLQANTWQQLSGVVTVPAEASSGSDYKHRLYVETGSRTADIYVDDFEICEIISTTPEVVVAGNLIGENAGFENGDKTDWRSESGAPVFTVVDSCIDANSGNYAAKTTGRSQQYTTPQMFIENEQLDDNTYYYLSAMVRQAEPSTAPVSANILLQTDVQGPSQTSMSLPADSVAVEINESTYTKVASVVYNKDTVRAKAYVRTVDDTELVDLWTDDYVMLPITSSVAKGAEDITPNSDITLTVPEDITVNATTLTINNGAEIENIDCTGTTYTVSFSGMDYDNEYVLKLDTDLNTDPTWEFKTESSNLLGSYDPGFENGSINTSKWNLSGTVERVSDVKHSGSYSAKSTAREIWSGPQAKFSDLTVGNKYYVSAWVYTTQTGQTAKMCLAGSASVRTSTVDLEANTWQQVSGEVTVPAEASSGSDYKHRLYVETGARTADIYVDDFELYLASDVTVSSALNGETSAAVDSDLTLVFSDTVNLAASNLTIDNGATIGEIHTTDNKTYTIDLGTLNDFTQYTVNIKGVFDSNYCRVKDAKIIFTTFSADPSAMPNMLSSYDSGFESGSINTSKWNLSGTVERVSDVKHSGSYSAKTTTRNTYSGPQAKFSDLTVGDQYYVSAWVYTTQAGQTAKMCLAGATNVRTSTVNLDANTWQQVRGVVTVPEEASSSSDYKHRLYIETGERTEDIYIDDFFMTPYTPTVCSSTTPANNESEVSIREIISITFTNPLDEVQTLADKFTVSGMNVTNATLQEDKKTVVLTLNSVVLNQNTDYTVTVSGLIDCFGEIVAGTEINFTTGNGLAMRENTTFTRGGAPITYLTPGEVTVKAKVANDSEATCAKPVMIVAVYDALGHLIDVAATEFDETLGVGHSETDGELSKTINVDSSANSITVHIWKSANNISYMESPAVLRVSE